MALSPAGRRLLAESAAARGYLIAALVLGLAVTGLIIAQAWLLASVLGGAAPGVAALTGTFVAPLVAPFVALLVVVVIRAAASFGSEVTASLAAAKVRERLRSRLLARVLGNGPAWLSAQPAGEITALATTGLDSLDPYFTRYLPQSLLAVAVPAAVLIAVTTADWLSGLIIAVTLPTIPVFAVLIGWQTKARTRQSWRLLARLSGHFLDVVQGLTTLKVFGQAKAQEQVIEQITDEYRVSVLATLRIAFLSALVLELAASVATALVAVEVGLRLLYGHLSYPTALFVLLLTPEAFLPVRAAAAQFHASADGKAAAGRVFEILDEERSLPAFPGSAPVPDLRTECIRLDDVCVSFAGRSAPALEHCDLIIRPGDRISLIGSNGAGKSTLLNLLLHYLEPTSGTVLAGDTDVAAVPGEAWRRQFGWLPQRPALFPWSVAENIGLGSALAARPAIERAARLAGADEFISELPDGYDTVLDERALRLSSGQRQKIALARLFCRDAPVMLLDEPTARLDQRSAAEIDAAIRAATAGRTVILVTHLGAGPGSDSAGSERVLLLADGRLTELTGQALARAG